MTNLTWILYLKSRRILQTLKNKNNWFQEKTILYTKQYFIQNLVIRELFKVKLTMNLNVLSRFVKIIQGFDNTFIPSFVLIPNIFYDQFGGCACNWTRLFSITSSTYPDALKLYMKFIFYDN